MNATSERGRRAELYAERTRGFRACADALRPRLQRWMSLGAIAILAAAIVFLAVLLGSAPPLALLAVAAGVTLSGFAFVRRARLEQAEDEASRRWRVNANAEARCRDAWRTLPEDGAEFIDPTHPHSSDLDVFGPGSLFQFVNVAHTRHGQRALARFFTDFASLAESRARQQAVRRLAPELALRQMFETLTLPSPQTPDAAAAPLLPHARPHAPELRLDTETLLEWAEAPARISQRRALVWMARIGPLCIALAFTAAQAFDAPPLLWKLGVLIHGVIAFRTRRDIATLFGIVCQWQGAFARLARVFHAMDHLPLDAPLLQQLRRAVQSEAASARLELRRLDRILGWFALRNSEWAHPPINLLLCWDIHCVVGLEGWWLRNTHPPLGRRRR